MSGEARRLGLGAEWTPPAPPGHHTHPEVSPARPAPASSVVAVCSGKGGVGKSSVALNLAVAFAQAGERVGLLDADVHAPDIPLMLGLARTQRAAQWTLSRAGGLDRTKLEPVECAGVRLMSTGFVVAEDQAVAWTADLVSVLLNQLIWSTQWGELDRLVVDMPPGTSDITQAVVRLLPNAVAVLVVTPQDAAHLDTRRLLAMLQPAGVAVAGGIENMSALACPGCAERIDVFPPVAPGRSIWAAGVPHLGSVPLVAAGAAGHAPEPVVGTAPQSPRAEALRDAAARLRAMPEQ